MTATVEVWGLVTFNFGGQWTTRPITLIGIQPEEKATVGPLVQYLESYHTLKDGKKVIREPLRSFDEPPSWNLTAEAKAWRHEINQRRKWIEDHARRPPRVARRRGRPPPAGLARQPYRVERSRLRGKTRPRQPRG